MPELPEVEYVARQLQREVVGRTITDAVVEWPRAVDGSDVTTFAMSVAGQRVSQVSRRGKYVLLTFESGDVLTIHRRMSGNLVLCQGNEVVPYTRVSFLLNDGRRLAFSDPRRFGRLRLLRPAELQSFMTALGVEPLAETFTPEVLCSLLARSHRAVKSLLLDQTMIAGLGNIYADEALFAAQIHPLRPAASLAPAEINALHAAILSVLMTAIEHGGTTFGRHRDAFNEAGRNVEHVHVYRRAGRPCRRCGAVLQRTVVAQRGTHFCPVCQPATEPSRAAHQLNDLAMGSHSGFPLPSAQSQGMR